jgi:hypothetical protein
MCEKLFYKLGGIQHVKSIEAIETDYKTQENDWYLYPNSPP